MVIIIFIREYRIENYFHYIIIIVIFHCYHYCSTIIIIKYNNMVDYCLLSIYYNEDRRKKVIKNEHVKENVSVIKNRRQTNKNIKGRN